MSCSIESRVLASACYDCLDDREKHAAIVYLKALALIAAGGFDYTNPNVLREAAECLICGGIGKLKAFAVLNALALAESQGAEVPATASDLKASIKCWCGVGQDELAAWESTLDCLFAEAVSQEEHYWPLNEASGVRKDILGTLDLTPFGTVAQISGALDFAAQVNPSLGIGKLVSDPTRSFRRNTGWTFSWWYKMIGVNPIGDMLGQLLDYNSAALLDSEFYLNIASGINLKSYLCDGLSTELSEIVLAININDGGWHMLTVTFNHSTSTLTVYVDASLQGSDVNSKAPNPDGQPITVGQSGVNDVDTDIGISDVGVWTRPLSGSEITALYGGGTPVRPV